MKNRLLLMLGCVALVAGAAACDHSGTVDGPGQAKSPPERTSGSLDQDALARNGASLVDVTITSGAVDSFPSEMAPGTSYKVCNAEVGNVHAGDVQPGAIKVTCGVNAANDAVDLPVDPPAAGTTYTAALIAYPTSRANGLVYSARPVTLSGGSPASPAVVAAAPAGYGDPTPVDLPRYQQQLAASG